MSRFTRSLSAEFRKVRATKMWWILIIVIFGYSAMMGGVFGVTFAEMSSLTGEAGAPAMDPEQMGRLVLATPSTFAYVVPLLFGAIMATGELRHRILGLAFIAEPKRGIVLASKVTVLLVIGAILGLAGVAGALAAGLPFLPEGAITTDVVLLMVRVVVALALWAVVGFGLGLLIRNQAVTIVLVLVFTQFLEPILRMVGMFWEWTAEVAKFLPGSASDAFVGASVLSDMSALDPSMDAGNQTTFGVWPGFAVLVAYALASVLAGWWLRWRKDVQ